MYSIIYAHTFLYVYIHIFVLLQKLLHLSTHTTLSSASTTLPSLIHPTPPVTGPHWEAIGFQGLDPSTDLNRSMKALTLLLTLHMIDTEPALAARLFRLSIYTDNLKSPPTAGQPSQTVYFNFWCMLLYLITTCVCRREGDSRWPHLAVHVCVDPLGQGEPATATPGAAKWAL